MSPRPARLLAAVALVALLLPVAASVRADMNDARKYMAYPLGAMGGTCIHSGEDYCRITGIDPGGPLSKTPLRVGDEIIGFALGDEMVRLPADKGGHDPMRMLGEAIDAACARPDCTLKLMIRAGRREGWEKVVMPPLGRFGKNFPFNCPKSARMFHANCDWMIAHMGLGGGSPGAWMGLALMCSSDPRHQAHVHKMAAHFEKKLANGGGGHNTQLSWEGIFLAEYSYRYAKQDPAGFLRRSKILTKVCDELVRRQARPNNKGNEPAGGMEGVFFHGFGDRCYGGTGQNLSTTAAVMCWATCHKIGGARLSQGAWDLTYKFLTRKCMGGNENGGYGIGYSAGGPDGEGSARTAQFGHALLNMGLENVLSIEKFPPIKYSPADVMKYGAGAGKWCFGNSPSTPECHAVGSFGMIAATSLLWRTGGLAAYRAHMDRWKWYLALSMQPDGHARFVPGYIGASGDSYLGENQVANCISAMMLAAPTRKLVMFGLLDAKGPKGPKNPYGLGGALPAATGEYKIGDSETTDPVGVGNLDAMAPSIQGTHKMLLRGEYGEALQRLDELKGKKLSEAERAAIAKMIAFAYEQGMDPCIRAIEEPLAAGDPLAAFRCLNQFKLAFEYFGDRKAKVAALEAQFQNPATSALMDVGRAYEKVLLVYQAQPEEYRPKMEAFAKAHPDDFYGKQAVAALAIQEKSGAPKAGGQSGGTGGLPSGGNPPEGWSPVAEED